MTYWTRWGFMGGFQNERVVMVTWLEDNVKYWIDSAGIFDSKVE